MDNWITRERRSVKLIHHSTSSAIQLIITEMEEVEYGKSELVQREIWFDYYTFADLKYLINDLCTEG